MNLSWTAPRDFLGVALALALTATVLFFVAIAAFDFRYVRPYVPEIERILTQAPNENRYPPAFIRKLLTATHRGSSTSYQVHRLISLRVGHAGPQRTPWRQLNEMLWSGLLPFHFDAESIDALYCTLEYNGQGYGAEELAQRLFSKHLSELSREEAATIVAVFRSPRRLLDDKGTRERIRDRLLAKVNASSQP